MEDKVFAALDHHLQKKIETRILTEIGGRMMEEIVLLQTKIAKPDMMVFTLQFDIRKYDMVVVDKDGNIVISMKSNTVKSLIQINADI